MHVMLIEDDRLLRHTLARVMRRFGFERVTMACNGLEALALLTTVMPDVILTDLQMPEMNGLTFAMELRGRGDGTPMIMLSGQTDEDAVASAIEAGVNCFIAKPATVQQLADALALVLPDFATAA